MGLDQNVGGYRDKAIGIQSPVKGQEEVHPTSEGQEAGGGCRGSATDAQCGLGRTTAETEGAGQGRTADLEVHLW